MLGGERREVTLLFGDLRGFTGFSERASPETAVHLLNAHFEAMVGIINTHGGFVVDFLGDSLFAVFGAPLADAGHARKAVNSAVEMQLVRQRLNEQNEAQGLQSLEMGIGINTGGCIVGNMGAMQRIKVWGGRTCRQPGFPAGIVHRRGTGAYLRVHLSGRRSPF